MPASTYRPCRRSFVLSAVALASCVGGGIVATPSAAATPLAGKADKVLVAKGERRLYLMRGGRVLRDYRVALGRRPRGTKLHEGDGRTPEGSYVVDARNPGSRFYRALHVSYPNGVDRARARALGEPAGGLIMVHGLPNERPAWDADHWMFDWTNGCIAVTNREMDELWSSIDLGTPIVIRP